MTKHRFLLVSLLALTATLPAQGGAGAAPDKPDKEVAEKLKALKAVVADVKFEHDAEGLDIITVLVQKWRAGLGEKDQKDIVKGLEDVLLKGKVRPADRIQLYTGAAAALAETGAMGAESLKKGFDSERFGKSPYVPLREALLKSLGKTRNEKMVEFLIKIARNDPEAAFQAAAGEALGQFEASDQKIRKEIVDQLLVKYGSMDSRASSPDPADIEAQNIRDRLAVLSGRWNDALRRLTKQNFDKFIDWQNWNNKNKNKDWN